MSCLGVHFALSDEDVAVLLSLDDEQERLSFLQEELEERYFAEPGTYIAESHKSWDAMHRALSDGKLTWDGGSFPLNHTVLGGKLLYSDDDYIMSLKTPEQVQAIASALETLTQSGFRKRYDQIDRKSYDGEIGDEDFAYTWQWFQTVRELYRRAAAERRHVLFRGPVGSRSNGSRLLRCVVRQPKAVLAGRKTYRNNLHTMKIKTDDLQHPAVHALLSEHLHNMYELSPPESVHALDLEKLLVPEITFWTVWENDLLLGCGALKELDDKHGEIKSMRTPVAHRRREAGRAILAHIIEVARERAYQRVSLETGTAEAFRPAQQLYKSFGFKYCGPFGDYREDPNSVFMTLLLE